MLLLLLLLSCFSCVQLLVTPWTAAYQAPLSMGFSRQEYWSGVPLPFLQAGMTRTFLVRLVGTTRPASSVWGIGKTHPLEGLCPGPFWISERTETMSTSSCQFDVTVFPKGCWINRLYWPDCKVLSSPTSHILFHCFSDFHVCTNHLGNH